jgi:hypothetical protein
MVDLGCLIKITELLNTIRDSVREDGDLQCVLACSVLKSLTAIVEGSQALREGYESTVTYHRLRQLVTELGTPPSTPVLSQAISMVVEGEYEYQSHSHSIYNTWALAMLLRWLPSLPENERAWLAERLYDLISFGAHNRQRCCGAGLITVVTDVLCASQKEGGFSEEVEVLLVHILEVLGSHSIQTAELKHIIGALRPLPHGQLPTYYFSVQKALSVMSHDITHERMVPLCYFDLRSKTAIISLPPHLHFPSSTSSLSFHTWVCLDYPRTTGRLTYSTPVSRSTRVTPTFPYLPHKRRRILFSFYSGSGNGLETFFTNSLVLVVAIATKREFTTLCLSDYPLTPLVWHSVGVVFNGAKRPWQKGELKVFVDGELKRSVAMKCPNLSDTYRHCHIGSVPPNSGVKSSPDHTPDHTSLFPGEKPALDSVLSLEEDRSHSLLQCLPLSEVEGEWGRGTAMRGLLSSFCLFTDHLSPSAIRTLYTRGPNDLSLFQPKCPETREMGSRLLVYYHAKACRHTVCMNLSPSSFASSPDSSLDGHFTGQYYVTRDVKAALSSLGGVGLLFPLLEQVATPTLERRGESARNSALSPSAPIAWFDSQEGVASFFRLLLSMLGGSPTNQQVFMVTEGPAILGALLQKVTPSQLTVQALTVIQELVALLSNHNEQYWQLMRHLLFNFHIWSRPDFSVRIGHTNYILTVVRDNLKECRAEFGVHYFLDVIRIFYSSIGSHVTTPPQDDMVFLTSEEMSNMRMALLTIIKLYLSAEVRDEDLDAVFGFVSSASDQRVQEELLEQLLSLLRSAPPPPGLLTSLWSRGLPLLVLIRAESMAVRLISIKILSHLYMIQGGVSASPLHSALGSGSLAAAVCQMANHTLSSSLIIALLELCVSRQHNFTEYISNFSVYFSLLQLLRNAPLVTRYTICQQLISILHLLPTHVNEFSSFPDWVDMFLWLLTPFSGPQEDGEGGAQEKEEKEKSCYSSLVEREGDVPAVKVECVGGEGAVTGGGEMEGFPPYRQRLSAFVNSPLPSAAHDDITPRCSSSGRQPRCELTSSTHTEEEDVWQTFHIVTETVGYILWHSVDYERHRAPWKVWGSVLSSVNSFTSSRPLLLPAYLVKQRLFTLLMNAVRLDAEAGEVEHSSLLDVVLQLSLLLETFVLSSCPHFTPDADDDDIEAELQKLSVTMRMNLDPTHCSSELFEHYLAMLGSARVFQSRFHTTTDVRLGQSVMRVLLAAISYSDKEFYVTAAVKLSQLVTQCQLPEADSIFLLHHLSLALHSASSDHPEQVNYMITIIGCIITQHGHALSLSDRLPGLPEPSSPTFLTSFLSFSSTQQWLSFVNDDLQERVVGYQAVLFSWLETVSQRERECREECTRDKKLRQELVFQHEHSYQEDILAPFFALRDAELERQRSHDNQQHSDLLASLQRWRGVLRFFTGERGAWSSRSPEQFLWRLNRSENFSRMRLKLSRDYTAGRHRDASRLRDLGSVPYQQLVSEPDTALLSLIKVSSRSQTLDEEEVLEQLAGVEGGPPGIITPEAAPQQGAEVVVRREMCDLVQFMDRVPGQLEITTHHLFFLSSERRDSWVTGSFKVRLDQLREIHSRRFNMQRTAIEIFLTDQTNYFINFSSSKVVTKVYNSIASLRTPNLTRVGIRKPARLLQSSGLTQRWVKREISNFDYLMHLNNIAGRTYNDLNQYPVFPWVLVDFESEELDLTDPGVFRDFTKPVGSQNPVIEQTVTERYEEFDDPTMGKFHFGSHYSNAAGVLHYLIRLEPFTSLHIDLQSGRFDHADRQFFSITSSWSTIYNTGTDVKELIPEFFYLPDFLKNINDYDLGKLQSGERLGDVLLPKWAATPEDFIATHREALECDYVSSQLHHWIDLIFGYKQIGPEAEKATNVFNYYSYEDNVNLEKIEDEGERRQIESIINNFGQTPTQLFMEPHPQRMTSQEARRSVARGYGKKSSCNLLEHLDNVKTHCVDVSGEEDPVVFVGTPTIQTRALIASGNPEQLVTVTISGRLNIHGWLPFSSTKSRPFTFQFDPNAHFDRSRWQTVAGPFSQDIPVSHGLFILSPNNKLLVTCGHWDNSFRVFSIERSKLLARIEHHEDVVTCMALDRVGTGDHLITGSRDTTCVVWRFGSNEVYDHPLQTLYGHDSEVTCVDISTELDMTVSGAKDGTCIIHTVQRGHYMHTLLPRKERHKCVVRHALISPLGRLLVYTEDKLARSKDIQCQLKPPCLHLYSVNAALITEKDLSEYLNDVVIVESFIITGNARGFLTFRDLFT